MHGNLGNGGNNVVAGDLDRDIVILFKVDANVEVGGINGLLQLRIPVSNLALHGHLPLWNRTLPLIVVREAAEVVFGLTVVIK